MARAMSLGDGIAPRRLEHVGVESVDRGEMASLRCHWSGLRAALKPPGGPSAGLIGCIPASASRLHQTPPISCLRAVMDYQPPAGVGGNKRLLFRRRSRSMPLWPTMDAALCSVPFEFFFSSTCGVWCAHCLADALHGEATLPERRPSWQSRCLTL